jgi:hypothetical protein
VEVAIGISFHFKLMGGYCLVKGFVILYPIILAIFFLPEEFLYSSCQVNSFLVRFMYIICTWYIAFKILCSFLLQTRISLFMQEEPWRSYLCGIVIVKTFVCLFWSANFLMCLRPVFDSYLFGVISTSPNTVITSSSRCR